MSKKHAGPAKSLPRKHLNAVWPDYAAFLKILSKIS
jgi:hypothetical protein